ncbi:hypothetical protein JCM11641_001336 [Rhodosporidiobolus odoratus]
MSMSNLIPSTLKGPTANPAVSQATAVSPSPLPPSLYIDCQTCRSTGTVAFAAVGAYAMTVGRASAKSQIGKGAASLFGLGFLALAAGRWTAYAPPLEQQASR